ncbi:LysR family transcriptional regulator [Shewanella atlantica]|uniref:LysR family transcriptional regulator n=1 Tax=Shewanella atlantica TaxID=271099 RepID=UPI0037352BCD
MIKNLNRLDLFTLKVMIELYEQKNSTVVAQRLQTSQPKVSRAISCLREVFDDVLFIRRQYGMEPNKIADKIYPLAKSILSNYDTLAAIKPYDIPLIQEINIAVQDHTSRLLMDCLRQSQEELQKNLVFHFHDWTPEVETKLSRGQMDYCVSINASTSDNVDLHPISEAQHLFLVGRKGHPIFTQTLTPSTIFNYPIALFNFAVSQGNSHLIESIAQKLNLPMKTSIKTSNIELLLDILEQSDDLSILGSVLSLELIQTREELDYIYISDLWTREMNQAMPFYYLLSHKSADPDLTASLVNNIKLKILELQNKYCI